MPISSDFPGSLDVIGTVPDPPFNQSQTILVNGTPMTHRDLMNFLFRATEAQQAKLGTSSSTPATNTVLRGTGTGTSAFGAVQAGDMADGATRKILAFIGPIGSPQANFDFTSIPGSWTHLSVEVLGRSSIVGVSDTVQVRFNNDSSAIYANQVTYSNNTTPGSLEALSQNSARCGLVTGSTGLTNAAGMVLMRIPFYPYTNFDKVFTSFSTVVQATSSGGMYTTQEGGVWRSFAAITRVTLTLVSGSNWAAGSIAALYGEP